MTDTKSIDIRPLAPALGDALLGFFDRDAFPDNPKWASCYCFFGHAPHDREKWETRTAAQNRSASKALIESGGLTGHLAYVDGKLAGWCNANLRKAYTSLDPDDDLEADAAAGRVGAIVCFVVAPPFRGLGIASRLLDATCAAFARSDVTIVEAYPLEDASTPAARHHGPLAMYLNRGFQRVRVDGGTVTVRKRLVPAGPRA